MNEGIQLCFGNIPSRNTLVLSFASYIQGSIIKTEKLLGGKFVNTSSAKRVLSVIFFHQFWGATNCKIPLKYLQYNSFFGFTLPDDVVEDVWSKRRDENTWLYLNFNPPCLHLHLIINYQVNWNDFQEKNFWLEKRSAVMELMDNVRPAWSFSFCGGPVC